MSDIGVKRGIIRADIESFVRRLPYMLQLDEDPEQPLWRE